MTRYAHSTGYHVTRRFGWDTHGLPVEHEIDKKLGIQSKEDVMKLGIAEYNKECRAIVMRYADEWRKTIERMGRWIDFENDYKTLYPTFMESVWWAFRQLYEKDKVYRGYKVMPYSTGCTTPLSNFEAGQNYQDVSDPSIVVSFPLVSDPTTSLLAWTTTPWTLPSNCAVCVNPDFTYIKMKDEKGNKYILLEERLVQLYKNPKKEKIEILEKFSGKEMEGWEYIPLFNYFEERIKSAGGFKVLNDTYVSAADGTGIVHQAPAFGEEDYRICLSYGIIEDNVHPPCPITDSGLFTAEVPDYQGIYIKTADKEIQKHLKAQGRLIVQATFVHSYPFCWRSDTPLLYKAVPSWFVRVAGYNQKMLDCVNKTHWTPSFVRDRRFGDWIANARDWNVSRNRYWGTPIPLWVSDDYEEIVCIGSIEELETLSGTKGITDLHRHSIDDITIPSKIGKGKLRRVEEVFDCWFESGSMPYASRHYPFEGKNEFESSFPAQFIAEGLDQTRGWFYTLLVLSAHLFDTAPFENVIVNGIVLAADGKKMSKRLKNYPEPKIILDKFGADALRLYLISSPVVRAETLKFREDGVRDIITRVLLPWWNSFKFFEQQVILLKDQSNMVFKYDPSFLSSTNVMDRWILATCQSLLIFIKAEMTEYRLYTVIPRLLLLIDELTNWYIRFNRKRLKGEGGLDDTMAALTTLFETLYILVRAMCPFTPFLSENIYLRLKPYIPSSALPENADSVHYLLFPEPRNDLIDEIIERKVQRMQKVIEMGRVIRERKMLNLKTPLKALVVVHQNQQVLDDIKSLDSYITEELNVTSLLLTKDEAAFGIEYSCAADLKAVGRRLGSAVKQVRSELAQLKSTDVQQIMRNGKVTVADVTLDLDELMVWIAVIDFTNRIDYSNSRARQRKLRIVR